MSKTSDGFFPVLLLVIGFLFLYAGFKGRDPRNVVNEIVTRRGRGAGKADA